MQSTKNGKERGFYGNSNINKKSNGNGTTNNVSVWSSWFTVFMVLCVLFGIIAIATPPKGKIVIDGLTDDWEKLLAEKAAKEFLNPLDNYYDTPYDMEKIRAYYDEKRNMIYFGIHFRGSFGYAKTQPNTLHILIDRDADSSTGYNLSFGGHILGIDNWIEVIILNDTVRSNSVYSYEGDKFSWEWKKIESGFGDRSDDGTFIELGYKLDLKEKSKFFILTKIGYNEYLSPIYSLSQESCLITVFQRESIYYLRFTYVTKAPEVVYVSLKTNNCKLYEDGKEIKSNLLMPLKGGRFTDGELRNISVEYNVSCSVEVFNVGCTPNTIVTVFGEKFVGYKGTVINIDGNFNDWKRISKLKNLEDNPYPNVDIREYAGYVSDKAIYIYVKVAGTPLGGAYVPKVYLYGGQPQNVSFKPYNYSEDYMKITINLINGTKKVIEIFGSLGNIKKILLDNSTTGSVLAAVKGSEIEIGWFVRDARTLSFKIEMVGLWCGIREIVYVRGYEISVKHSSIEIDGKVEDWIGNSPSNENVGCISGGEYIWRDKVEDEVDTFGKPGDTDITEFRITSDGTFLYLLVKFRDLNKVGNYTEDGQQPFGHEDLGVGIIISIDYENGGNIYLPKFADTMVDTPWEKCIFVTAANSGRNYDNLVINGSEAEFDIYDINYNDVASSQSKAIFNATGNVLEIGVYLSDLEITTIANFTINFTVSTIVYNWSSQRAAEIGNSSVSNIIDVITDKNSTAEEINDGIINPYARIIFIAGGDVIKAEGPLPLPELSIFTNIMVMAVAIFVILPVVKRN